MTPFLWCCAGFALTAALCVAGAVWLHRQPREEGWCCE